MLPTYKPTISQARDVVSRANREQSTMVTDAEVIATR
jgi:hypothetical protein